MLNISLNGDTQANKEKIGHAVIKNLSNFCDIHVNEKTLYLCLTCKTNICEKCKLLSMHKDHHIILKNEINNYEKILQDKRLELDSKLKQIGFDCNFQDFYKKFRSDFNKRGEEMLELVETIKKREEYLLNKFKTHLDKYFPKIMDYRDNLDNLLSKIENNRDDLLKNENEFIDFYDKFSIFKETISTSDENVTYLTTKITKYNGLFDLFKEKTDDILDFINENLEQIYEIQTTEEHKKIDNIDNLQSNNKKNRRGSQAISQAIEFNIVNYNKNNEPISFNNNRDISSSNDQVKIKDNQNEQDNQNKSNSRKSLNSVKNEQNEPIDVNKNESDINIKNFNSNESIKKRNKLIYNNDYENQSVNKSLTPSVTGRKFRSPSRSNTPSRLNTPHSKFLNLPKELTTKMVISNTINKAKAATAMKRLSLSPSKVILEIVNNESPGNTNRQSNRGNGNNFGNSPSKFNFNEENLINLLNVNSEEEKNKSRVLLASDELDSEKIVENNIINIIVSTKNLLIYNNTTNTISKKETDLSNLNFKKFEAFHSTLNFKNNFYISGGYGYSSSKNFCKYNMETNNFTKLADMLTGHSYNGLMGFNNDIYAISGFKSNKVERYSLLKNEWTKLPDLNIGRSWPNCFFVKNYLYVTAGSIENKNEGDNKCFECLDLNKCKIFERIVVNIISTSGDIPNFPFNCGLIKLNDNEIYYVGGRLEKDTESVKTCWNYDLQNKNLELKDDISLSEAEEFDGKTFVNIGNDKYGLFSAIYYNKFYVFSRSDKNFQLVQFEEELL